MFSIKPTVIRTTFDLEIAFERISVDRCAVNIISREHHWRVWFAFEGEVLRVENIPVRSESSVDPLATTGDE